MTAQCLHRLYRRSRVVVFPGATILQLLVDPIVFNTVEIDYVNMMAARSAPKARRGFVSRMAVDADAHFQGAIKVLATSSFVLPMAAASDAVKMVAISLRLGAPSCARHMEEGVGALLMAATNLRSRQPSIASSTEVEKSVGNTTVTRWLAAVPSIAPLMAEGSDANWKGATALPLGSCNSVGLMVGVVRQRKTWTIPIQQRNHRVGAFKQFRLTIYDECVIHFVFPRFDPLVYALPCLGSGVIFGI
jgi:hypothetical protein